MMQFDLGTIALDTSFSTGNDSGLGYLGLGLTSSSGTSTGSSPCSSDRGVMCSNGTSTGSSPSSGTSTLSPASLSPRSDTRCDTPVSTVSSSPSGSASDTEKPPHSYIALISMAILNSKEKKLLLGDIYKYITDNYIYYAKMEDRAWRNSIRHNLSLNECFIKNGRADNGKGSYWSVHPACVEDFRKGDYRRRQARRRAKKGQNQVSQLPAAYRNTLSYIPMSSVPLSTFPVPPIPAAYPGYSYQPYQTYPGMSSLGYTASDYASAAMNSAYTRSACNTLSPTTSQSPLDLSSTNSYSTNNNCAYTNKSRDLVTQASYPSQQSQVGPMRPSYQMKERRGTSKPYSQNSCTGISGNYQSPLISTNSMMQTYMTPYSQLPQSTMMPGHNLGYDSMGYSGLTPFSSAQLQALWESMSVGVQQR